jgi:hypothetical protein
MMHRGEWDEFGGMPEEDRGNDRADMWIQIAAGVALTVWVIWEMWPA